MKRHRQSVHVLAIVAAILVWNCSRPQQGDPREEAAAGYYSPADFTSLPKRDAHVHLNTADPSFIRQATEDNFSLVTINVDTPRYPPIDEQESIAVAHMKAFPGRIAYAATFPVARFGTPDWQDETVRRLAASFSKGAVAVKFWKNIGMELKDAAGRFVMIDNPEFDAVIEFIAQQNATAIGHIGEPKNCWLPLSAMTVKTDRTYYGQHPEYHMFMHPEYPTYEQHLEARDRMLAKHPNLTFVGAHLASVEWSVDELAKRLDDFPHMAVDTAARIPHLQYQARTEREKVRRFFIKYQDRVIYGTDQTVGPKRDPAVVRRRAHDIWTSDWRFLTSADTMTAPEVDGRFQGLRLPREVIDKVYRTNSERWFGRLRRKEAPHQQTRRGTERLLLGHTAHLRRSASEVTDAARDQNGGLLRVAARGDAAGAGVRLH